MTQRAKLAMESGQKLTALTIPFGEAISDPTIELLMSAFEIGREHERALTALALADAPTELADYDAELDDDIEVGNEP
jgi:hypothetical protein